MWDSILLSPYIPAYIPHPLLPTIRFIISTPWHEGLPSYDDTLIILYIETSLPFPHTLPNFLHPGTSPPPPSTNIVPSTLCILGTFSPSFHPDHFTSILLLSDFRLWCIHQLWPFVSAFHFVCTPHSTLTGPLFLEGSFLGLVAFVHIVQYTRTTGTIDLFAGLPFLRILLELHPGPLESYAKCSADYNPP